MRRTSNDKTLRQFFRRLKREHGIEAEIAMAGHVKLVSRDGVTLCTTSCTPKCPHTAVKQITRELRRYHGIEV